MLHSAESGRPAGRLVVGDAFVQHQTGSMRFISRSSTNPFRTASLDSPAGISSAAGLGVDQANPDAYLELRPLRSASDVSRSGSWYRSTVGVATENRVLSPAGGFR